MRNVSDKRFRDFRNTYSVFNNFFFNRAVYEMIWKNFVERGRPQKIWRMHIAYWLRKATNKHPQNM